MNYFEEDESRTYAIVLSADKTQLGMKCFTCGFTSYNTNDIKQLYCNKCKVFYGPIKADHYVLVDRVTIAVKDILVWAEWLEKQKDRIVKQEEIANYRISTVFLGITGWGNNPPLLYETMIFDDKYTGSELDCWQDRYATWEEAETGHAYAVSLVLDAITIKSRVLKFFKRYFNTFRVHYIYNKTQFASYNTKDKIIAIIGTAIVSVLVFGPVGLMLYFLIHKL